MRNVGLVCAATVATLALVSASAATAATLPVGAAKSFVFGSVKDEGSKISLPPRNPADVNQHRVARAPKVGPFHVALSAGEKAWPSACKLTDAAQLHGLFPAIIRLRGKPLGVKGENLGSGSSTPVDVQCKFNLKTSFDPSGYSETPSWVQINVEGIDQGEAAQYTESLKQQKAEAKKFPAQYADYPHLADGVKCFYDGNDLQCLKGDAFYWVSGQKVTGGSMTTVDQAVWVDQIEIPLAEKIGSELHFSR